MLSRIIKRDYFLILLIFFLSFFFIIKRKKKKKIKNLFMISNQTRLPAELKHISKRRKRN